MVRIGTYTMCKKVFGFKDPVPKPQYEVLCLGFEGAGKSSILAACCNESMDDVEPTQGFAIKAVQLPGLVFNVKEVAGSDKYRKYWPRYYDGNHGLILVLDGACTNDIFEQSLEAFNDAISSDELRSAPVLVLVNKSDQSNFRHVSEVEAKLPNTPRIMVKACCISNVEELMTHLAEFCEYFETVDEN